MQLRIHRSISRLVVTAGLLAFAGVAFAQAWPSQPVRVIVPYPAGGVADATARLLMERVAIELGQPIVIDNRGGGGGQIGTYAGTKARPDGNTLVFTTNGALSYATVTSKSLPYDPVRDLVPIVEVATYGLTLVVHPSLPVRSVPELIQYARTNPGKLDYSSAGTGTAPHFAGELLKMLANVHIVHIPYRGGAPALQDTVAGVVKFTFDGAVKSFVDDGRLRALATTDTRRDPRFPDLPTMEEAGLKGHRITGRLVLFGPAGTPPAIVARMNAAVNAALKDEKTRKSMAALGLVPVGGSADRVPRVLAEETEATRALASRARLSFD